MLNYGVTAGDRTGVVRSILDSSSGSADPTCHHTSVMEVTESLQSAHGERF